ncbi:MAG: F0F1 ATP synthase subunit alpha, partial [Clostridia bacterium]|nr:F0F1 ATP synthase subunit alpha [Clostridia bacterium]
FLETELFHAGVMPAVNPGISVSRVGGNAQIKAMKKVAGSLKLSYSQYRELQSFAQFGSDLDADTKRHLAKGERIVEVLKQDRNSPIRVSLQVAIIYPVVNDMLEDVPVNKVKEFEKYLFEYIDTKAHEIIDEIETTGDMSKETEKKLRAVIKECAVKFKE